MVNCGNEFNGGRWFFIFVTAAIFISFHYIQVPDVSYINRLQVINGYRNLPKFRDVKPVPGVWYIASKAAKRLHKSVKYRILNNTAEQQLAVCANPKVMSSIMTSTVKFINDPERCNITSKEFAKIAYRKIKSCEPEKAGRPSENQNASLSYLAIARDPIEKLISGWVDKCYNKQIFCQGCPETDFKCFVKILYARMMRASREVFYFHFHHCQQAQELSLQLHQQYYSPGIVFNHFYPQNWMCEWSRDTLHNPTFKYHILYYEYSESFYQSLVDVLSEYGVAPPLTSEIYNALETKRTKHVTKGLPIKQEILKNLTQDPELCKYAFQLYASDYYIINWPLPDCVKQFVVQQ